MRILGLASVSALVLSGALVACTESEEITVSSGGGCTSLYEPVAEARTWPDLKAAMLEVDHYGPVASVRTQARGQDVGAGDEDAVRVVDLLNAKGRRLIQADVWRTPDGGWSAGVWSQCID